MDEVLARALVQDKHPSWRKIAYLAVGYGLGDDRLMSSSKNKQKHSSALSTHEANTIQ